MCKRSKPEAGQLLPRAVITVRESLAVTSSDVDADPKELVTLDGESELREQAEAVVA